MLKFFGKFKKFIPYGIILVLIVMLSVSQCQRQNLKDDVKAPFDSTAIFKSKLEAIQARGEAIKTKLHTDSLKTSIALNALKRENKTLKKKLADMRPDITRIADSIPIIDRWVDLTDSLDIIQEAELDSMRAERVRIWKGFNAIVFNRDEQIQLLTELVNHKEVISQDLRKKLRKERRKKTLFKITTGIAATLVLYLAIQD